MSTVSWELRYGKEDLMPLRGSEFSDFILGFVLQVASYFGHSVSVADVNSDG